MHLKDKNKSAPYQILPWLHCAGALVVVVCNALFSAIHSPLGREISAGESPGFSWIRDNIIICMGIGLAYLFLVDYRFPEKGDRRKQIKSLHITNAGIALTFIVTSWLIGWQTYLLIQLPILVVAGAGGVWLFYVQHQFEGVYWARHSAWDPMKAALEGSSFYHLPRLLQWFSGNIGFHHIHHVRPRIPNYHLKQCHDVLAPWQTIATLNLRDSLRSLRLKLWDEKHNRLVGFGVKNV